MPIEMRVTDTTLVGVQVLLNADRWTPEGMQGGSPPPEDTLATDEQQ